MNYIKGSIRENLIGEYDNLEFVNRPFTDQQTVERWKKLGHNYEKYTGLMRDQSSDLPQWCFDVKNQIPLQNSTATLYCMMPGTIMPEHTDTYLKYKQINNIDLTSKNVSRCIVFLEDWKSGHYFEVDNTPVTNWKRGDYVLWRDDTPHIAANIGSENRYTLQITGLNENS